jgi:hypothetical protein
MLNALQPFRPFKYQWPAIYGGELTPEKTPEIEFVTSDGQLFFTVDSEQLVVQES